MSMDNEQESRLISRGTPADDPTWGEVSSFLGAVESTYAEVPAARYERTVVAAVAQEARALRNDPQSYPMAKEPFSFKSHRLLIGVLAAAVVALPAGVAAAAATGNGPLAYLMPGATPETTAPAFEPTFTSVPTQTPDELPTETSSPSPSADDGDEAAVEPSPEPSPRTTTKAPAHRDNDDADEDSDEDSDDEGDDHEQAESESSHDSDEADHEAEDPEHDSEDDTED